MQAFLACGALLVLGAGLWLCLRGPDDELQQAALLPFADDPEAAQRMSAATGLHCRRVVAPVPEPTPGECFLA